ncbi:MAG: amino acid adenylation domain-containing protein, partial [Bacteroidota bacterium]
DEDVIFINGQNYYPHDIEEMALEVDSIELNKIVVGGLFNHEGQKEEVLAFVFHRSGLESFVPIVRQLKAHINLQAGFELDRIIPVKDIPRTTSGKLQRYRLLERYRKGQFAQIEQQLQELLQQAATTLSAIAPAQNDTETTLLKIWKAVLQTDEIGVTHRFFEIGGNSLKAAQIGAKVWKKFQVELPFDLLYEKQTVRELASEIAGCRPQQYEPVPVADTQRYYSLASAQKRLYYSWELDPDSTAYNMPFALKIDGKISADWVEGCIKAMIERHDVFRMTFHPREEPVFCIGESPDFSMGRYQVSPDGLQERLRSLVQPFDLTRAPLLRASLLTLNHFEHILFLDFHHIISDGMSVHHFIGELLALYADIKLPRPSVQFKDYAVWEGAQAMDEVAEQYWQQTFAGDIPLLELPLDKRRPKLLKRTGGKMEFDLGTSLSQQLRSLANQQGCTLHVLLLSLYRVLLAKYSTQEESIIGVPIAGRRHPDVQAMQGMFVNNLAVRNTISGDESFLSLLERESQQMRSALRHQQYAFDDLIQSLDLKRDVSRSPLFDTMFVFQSMGLPVLNNRSIGLSRHFFDPGFSKFDLTMEVFDEANISCALEYADELFDKDTILRLTKHFIHLSEQATRTPSARIADLPLLDTVEYKNIIQDFNNTDRERPRDTCIHHLFEARAKAQPKAIALISGTEKMTYAELNQQAALLAADLASRQVDTNDIIGILLDRSPEFIISLLAVLKTGAAYVPIDTDLPAERIRFILEDSKARLLLTDSKQRELTRQLRQESGLESIELDKWTAAEDLSPLKEQRGTADDLAYVIYTSGTTGRPKGVMIGHDSLVNYINWATEEYLQGEQAAFPLFTSVSFDLTVTSIFIPLTTGNRLLIYGEDKQSLLLDTVLANNQAEIVKLTPSHLRLLRKSDRFGKGFQSSIRRFIVGGEALEYELAKDIHDLFGGRVEIYNEYGPTEATVGCMIHRFDPAEKTNTVPIGIPAANTQIYVLDAFYKPVATGVKGELYVSGEGLAKAYLYRFELTRDRFVSNPFSAGQWMYKSGDIVRRLASGKLEYIQRVDHQVKINGYRIELAEIEQQLESHPAVSDALVRLEKNEADAAILYAYYCCHDQTNRTDAASLRHFLSERLPYYMMPMHFIALEQIPLTINGKIDYRALPQPVKDEEVLQPRNEMEQHFVSAWESILEMPVTIGDNFFELGGDSIKAVQIASRLAAKGIGIDVKDILTYQTIEQISLRASVRESTHQYDQGIQQGARGLTPIESWFVQQQFENPHHFNQSVLLKLNRAVQMDLLKEAFEMLLEQHDALRLNYRLDEQELYFNNRHLKQPFVIEEFSLTAQELYSGEQELFALFAPLKTQFDLADGLLFKAGVLRVGQRLQYLCITAHHLLVDGISWRILLEDFHQIYQGLEKGQSVELPAKTASSIDWHKALVEYASYEMSIDEINYWNEVSQTEFSLPQDFATEDWTVKNRRSIRGQLNREQTDYLLKEAHQAYKTDVPILLNAALVNTLKDWTAGELFVIEHENHGRHIEGIDVSRTVGWFTAMYPIRLTSQRGGMGEQIKAVKEQMRRVPNNGLGYGIQQYMGAETFPHQKNPSEIRFNYLGQFGRELENDLFSYTNLFSGSEIAEENHLTTKMECNLMIINGCLQLDIAYNSKAHSRLTVERFKDKYLHHLNAVLDHIRSEEDIHFTPSDFDAVDLNEEELDALLG